LQTVRHRFNIYASSCVALALWHGDGQRNTASIMKGLACFLTWIKNQISNRKSQFVKMDRNSFISDVLPSSTRAARINRV